MNYSGFNGFLGTRASLMLDIVFVAMFAVLVVLTISIYLVRSRRQYAWHKRLQLTLGGVLLLTLALFEIDMRLHGWRERAAASPYYAPIEQPGPLLSTLCIKVLGQPAVPGWVFLSLAIHLFFAVTTTLIWIWVIVRAVLYFPIPAKPCAHSANHKFWGWIAAVDMGLTALTGWIFYLLAFVA